MKWTSKIHIYFFKEDDGLSREDRLLRAAEYYFGSEMDNAFACTAEAGKRPGVFVDRKLLQIEKTPLGKPYFPNFPQLFLSISHSGAYWVCALSPVEVGVDIQEHAMRKSETRQEATVRFAKMAHRFFHPVEAKFVATESIYRFFGVWAARESFVKYTGLGIDASFARYCVIPEMRELWPELTPPLTAQSMQTSEDMLSGQKTAIVQSDFSASWQAQGACFWETVFEENYTLCVCTGEALPCRVICCF